MYGPDEVLLCKQGWIQVGGGVFQGFLSLLDPLLRTNALEGTIKVYSGYSSGNLNGLQF